MSFTAEFLQEQLSAQPFIPFTVVMNSDESFNIRSADYADIPPRDERTNAHVGWFVAYTRKGIPRYLAIANIASIEPIEPLILLLLLAACATLHADTACTTRSAGRVEMWPVQAQSSAEARRVVMEMFPGTVVTGSLPNQTLKDEILSSLARIILWFGIQRRSQIRGQHCPSKLAGLLR
jgi:hypothetical protein